MKKIFFLLIFSLTFFNRNYCQSYVLFPTNNAVWFVKSFYLGHSQPTMVFFVHGDTLINNKIYNKYYLTFQNYNWNDMNFNTLNASRTFFVREDSAKKLFCLIDTMELTLYDFNNKDVGDTLYSNLYCLSPDLLYLLPNNRYGIISQIDSIILLDGSYRKQYHFHEPYWGTSSAIEGIGTIQGLFFPIFYYFENIDFLSCFFGEKNQILSLFNDNGDCYLTSVGNSKMTSKIHVSFDYANRKILFNSIDNSINYLEIEIFNSMGNRIRMDKIYNNYYSLANLSSGIYLMRIKSNNDILYYNFFNF